MKVVAYYSNKGLDERLAKSFAAGVKRGGDRVKLIPGEEDDGGIEDADAVMLFGVKAREKFNRYRSAGVNTIILDKGYIRTHLDHTKECMYWRIAVNAHHPTSYLGRLKSPDDRWKEAGFELPPWQKTGLGNHVIYAGSSLKYHLFNGLPHPTEYAKSVVSELRRHTDRPIIYRPKPSWQAAEPVDGAAFSRHPERLGELLVRAHALVTNGSNSCFDAVTYGVPCIILGDAVAAPLSSRSLAEVEAPVISDPGVRQQWVNDLAYCQYSMVEMQAGLAWKHARRLIDGVV